MSRPRTYCTAHQAGPPWTRGTSPRCSREAKVVTAPSQEPSGDYGYDLAHAEQAGWWVRSANPSHSTATPMHPPIELDGDYGYDEAHGL
jgi:hypothetical protein